MLYHRRKQEKSWGGPAKVLGKEGNFVLICQGAAYYICHPLKVDPVHKETGTSKRKDSKVQRHDAISKKQQVDSNVTENEDSDINEKNDITDKMWNKVRIVIQLKMLNQQLLNQSWNLLKMECSLRLNQTVLKKQTYCVIQQQSTRKTVLQYATSL